MDDHQFIEQVKNQPATTKEEDQHAGQPVSGTMGKKSKDFLQDLFTMIDSGEIDIDNPDTFLNAVVYEKLDETWREKADLALANIASQLTLIKAFRDDTAIPDESPQLETMVEQLWEMKQRIEEHHDVFKF